MTEIVSRKLKAMKAMIAILFALTATLGLADETKFANEDNQPAKQTTNQSTNQGEDNINNQYLINPEYVNPKAGNLGNLDVLGIVARAIKDVQTMGRFGQVTRACHDAIAVNLAVAHQRWAAPYRLVDEADGPVPAAFAALGPVYRINDPSRKVPPFLLSDRAPDGKTHQAALDYCVAQGGRLPTRAELEALSRAMGYPDRYDDNCIPNITYHFFWSSDEAPPARPGGPRKAFGLFGNDGKIYDDEFARTGHSVRCVVEARGAVAHQRWAAPYRLVDEADGPVPAAFAALGPVYRINDPSRKVPPFLLSDHRVVKTHQAALDYCVAQGGRLPTRAELEALRRALGYPERYDRSRIPNMANNIFWSSDEAPGRPGDPSQAFGLDSLNGNIYGAGRYLNLSVRCVVEAHR